jgi:hypothetical protein
VKSTNWKDIAELVGIAAIIASLLFVGLQMKQTQEIALNDYRLNRVDSGIEAENARFEYAELWIRGNAGDELDPSERMIYEGLIDSAWNRAFWNTLSQRQLGMTLDIDIHDFARFLHRNPGAKLYWLNAADQRNEERAFLSGGAIGSTPSELQEIVRGGLTKLDQMSGQ